MQIICLSRGSFSQGKALAEALARKLGCACLSREALVEAAFERGIAVGKLETAILKRLPLNERLLLEKEHFQAFATAFLCERARDTTVVYHGRTGHLLLPDVSHVLRLRVEEAPDVRINRAMVEMHLSWEKAKRLVEGVDDDVRRWVRTYYEVDCETAAHYDLVLNLEQMSAVNAATALCTIAALPDFQMTPASHRTMENLHLAAKVRLALADDARTAQGSFRVSAEDGGVIVTYQPRYAAAAEAAPEVARAVEGVREASCTMAATNILWIQERFDPASPAYAQVVDLAQRWNAAVELCRFLPCDADQEELALPATPPSAPPPRAATEENGGIEDDVGECTEPEDDDLRRVHDRLARDGVAGGIHSACCRAEHLLDRLDTRLRYSLVVIDEVFLQKERAARVRLTRELASATSDRLKVPAVSPEELRKTYLFGPALAMKLTLLLGVAIALFALVMSHQVQVTEFLHRQGTQAKLLSAAVVAMIVPVFAYCYGIVTKNLLKLLRIE